MNDGDKIRISIEFMHEYLSVESCDRGLELQEKVIVLLEEFRKLRQDKIKKRKEDGKYVADDKRLTPS